MITFLFFTIILPSCEGLDDHYSTNPNLRLDFSQDTLSFDTIFSSIGSTTGQFLIYNRNSEPLNMESIRLDGAEETGFRMNVDGRKGTHFENIGILAKDSMYVFVEVTVNPNGSNQPLLIEDSVVFIVNGIQQRVLLQAYGQDVHLYKEGVRFEEDITLQADKPYLIYDYMAIAPNTTVTIQEGATFYMHKNTDVRVDGSLIAEGTRDLPITFRGDRLDNILEDLPYDRTPAQWGGIYFGTESYGNKFDYVIVRNGVNGIVCPASDPAKSKLILSNSQITNMDENVLKAINCHIEVSNTELTNARDTLVTLRGGFYRFTHCTLANYMTIFSRKDANTYTLHVSNALTEEQSVVLDAGFDNCVIDGIYSPGETLESDDGEIVLDILNPLEFDYYFNHCVLKTKEENNSQYNNVLIVPYNTNRIYKMFRMTGGKENQYAYDFQLDADTIVGVGAADPAITALYPVDRRGVNRLTGTNGPTIGAYEFVEKEKEEEK